MLQSIIERLTIATGASPETIQQAIAIMLNFVEKNAGSEITEKLFAAIPAARALSASGEQEEAGGLAGLGSSLLGAFGSSGDALAQFGRLKELDLSTDQISTIGEGLFTEARAQAGDEVVDSLLDEIPALKQILG